MASAGIWDAEACGPGPLGMCMQGQVVEVVEMVEGKEVPM